MYAGIGRLHDRRPHAWFFAATRAQVAITLGMVPLMLALFQQVYFFRSGRWLVEPFNTARTLEAGGLLRHLRFYV